MTSSERRLPLDHSKCGVGGMCCAGAVHPMWADVQGSQPDGAGPGTPPWDENVEHHRSDDAGELDAMLSEQDATLSDMLREMDDYHGSVPHILEDDDDAQISDTEEHREPLHARYSDDESSDSDSNSIEGDPDARNMNALDPFEAWGAWVLVSCLPFRDFREIDRHKRCNEETHYDLATRLVSDGTIRIVPYLTNMMHAVIQRDNDKAFEIARREAAAKRDLEKNPGNANAGRTRNEPARPFPNLMSWTLTWISVALLAESAAAQNRTRVAR